MTRLGLLSVAILASAVAASACSSEVQIEGGGGSGGGGTTSSTSSTSSSGGGGASTGCRALAPAGEIITLAGEGFTQFDLMRGLDGRVVLAQRIEPAGYYQTYFFDPWAQWGQVNATPYELESYFHFLLAEGLSKGVAGIGSNYSIDSTLELYLDVTGSWPAPSAEIAGKFAEAFVRSGDGYALASSREEGDAPWMDFSRLRPDGTTEWSRALGCGYGNGNQELAAAILPIEGGSHLVAFTDLKSGDCEVDVAERISVARLDSAGQGEPRIVYESEGDEMKVIEFLRLPEGPLLVFGDTIAGETTYFGLRLSVDGLPLDLPQPLGTQDVPFARAGVAKVEGGFVLASPAYEDYPQGRVRIALYDDERALLSTSASELLVDGPISGVRVVASPDGRSVLVAWTENVDPPAGNASPQILRFDCVEPGE